MKTNRFNSTTALWVVGIVLFVLSLTPPRAGAWVGYFARPIETVVAPVQSLLTGLTRKIKSVKDAEADDGPRVAELRRQLRVLEWRLTQSQNESEELRRQMAALQAMRAINPDVSAKLVSGVPVIGGSWDATAQVLKVRAGARHGVTKNSVCLMRSVNLVGRVIDVSSRYCIVRPITQKDAEPLQGVIVLDDGTPGPACPNLTPMGDGTLQGRVEFQDEYTAGLMPTVKAGQTVRLRDPTFPAAASMLVIGTIVNVETLANQRPVITVRPIADLSRVAEVSILTPESEDELDEEAVR